MPAGTRGTAPRHRAPAARPCRAPGRPGRRAPAHQPLGHFKRFNDLLAGLPGASPNLISQRLRELIGYGVILRRDLGPPARVRLCELTDWGHELEPVIVHLGRWGQHAPLPEGARAGLDSVLLAIQAMAGPACVTGRYELRIGADVFAVDGSSGWVRIRRGTAGQPEASLTTDTATFFAVVFGQRPIAAAMQAGDLRLDGSGDAISPLTSLLLTLSSPSAPAS